MVLNGIPWWYFHRDTQSGHAELQLDELDPGGKLWRLIGPERVIGCVALQGAEVVNPGEIRLSNVGRFVLGEPSGEISTDLESVAGLFAKAGLNVSSTPRIRDEIWSKLTGNAAFNPLSALTRALMTDIMANPALFDTVGKIMKEVRAVGSALGAQFSITIEERLEQSRHIGAVRTSMLQDLLAGKALEIVPLVGMVVALGRTANVPTPVSEVVLALVAQLDRENQHGG
jgi:2-dehydropantoate 2-reductase